MIVSICDKKTYQRRIGESNVKHFIYFRLRVILDLNKELGLLLRRCEISPDRCALPNRLEDPKVPPKSR